jgi:hypothetical protein
MVRGDLLFFQAVPNAVGDGLYLALLLSAADEEQIRKGAGACNIQGNRVGRFLLLGGLPDDF